MTTSLKPSLPSGLRALIFPLVFVSILGGVLVLFWPKDTASKSQSLTVESFASCLTDREVTLYGSDTCANCLNQKKMFGKAFEKVHYVNCDFQKEACDNRHIRVYPVWISGRKTLVGLQSLPDLAKFSNCKLPPSVMNFTYE